MFVHCMRDVEIIIINYWEFFTSCDTLVNASPVGTRQRVQQNLRKHEIGSFMKFMMRTMQTVFSKSDDQV